MSLRSEFNGSSFIYEKPKPILYYELIDKYANTLMIRSSKRHGVNIDMTNAFWGEDFFFKKKKETNNAKFDLFVFYAYTAFVIL